MQTPAAVMRALVQADPAGIGRMCHIKLTRIVTGALAAPDPLAVQTHAEALEDLITAADALLGTVSEHCTHRATRDDPAEYVPTHEGWAADDLRRAVTAARAVLNAEPVA